jgi:hypothetical protein
MALTDAWLKANDGKERAALAERGDREGLGVRITPKGKIPTPLISSCEQVFEDCAGRR